MKNQKKWIPSIGMVLTVGTLLLTLTGCAPTFEGDSVKNADAYVLEIQAMNGTDQHTLELKEGDVLQIQFETVKGSLSMEINAPDGTSIYQGNGKEATEFTIEIPTDGIYTVFVEGQKAKGSIRVDVEKKSDSEAAGSVTTTEPDTQDIVTVAAADLVGPWHLAEGTYDESTVNETFPGAMEFGSSMEITGDGKISWYIGADGGAGTYTLDGNILLASMTNHFDGTDMTIELTVEKDGDQLLLAMDYKGLALCWSWGEKETGKGGESCPGGGVFCL